MTRRGPGEGSIYQRKDGRRAGSSNIGYEGGKRIRKHVLGHSRAEVKEKLATVQRLQAGDRPIPDLRLKLGPFLRQWLDEVARPRVRASTHESYREIVEGHLVPGSAASPSPSSPRPRSRRSSTASRPRACPLAGSSTSTPSCAARW